MQLHVSMDYVERNACVRIDIVQSRCIDNLILFSSILFIHQASSHGTASALQSKTLEGFGEMVEVDLPVAELVGELVVAVDLQVNCLVPRALHAPSLPLQVLP